MINFTFQLLYLWKEPTESSWYSNWAMARMASFPAGARYFS
jgi:hypothetical protein